MALHHHQVPFRAMPAFGTMDFPDLPSWAGATALPGEFRKLFFRMPRLPFLVRHRAFPCGERTRRPAATRPRFAGVRQPVLRRQLGLLRRGLLGRLGAGRHLRGDLRFLRAVEMLTEQMQHAHHLRERIRRLLLAQCFLLLLERTDFVGQLRFRRCD